MTRWTRFGLLALLILVVPSATHAAITRSLSIGSTGQDVLALQELLRSKGYFSYPVSTGYFGPSTAKAVMAFQLANGLSPVGNVGPMTRAIINGGGGAVASAPAPTTAGTGSTALSPLVRPLGIGSTGSDVLALQTALKSRGLLSGTPTGVYDAGTALAVLTLQSQNHLETVGTVGPATRAIVNQIIASLPATGSGSGTTLATTGGSTSSGSTGTTVPNVPKPPTTTTTGSSGGGGGGGGGGGVTTGTTGVPTPPQLAAPTLTFTSSATTLPSSGGSVTLTWSTTDASSCTASGGWTGSQATSGTRTIQGVVQSTDFTLTCTGNNQTVVKTASVTVASVTPQLPAPTLTLTSSVTSLPSTGGSATLTWSSTNASSCTASNGWTGSVGTSGARIVQGITAASTFSLSCTGNGQTVVKSVSITLAAPVVVTPPPVTTPPVTTPPSVPGSTPSSLVGTYPVYSGCEAPASSYLRTIYIDPIHGSDTTGDGTQARPYRVLQNFFDTSKYQSGDHIILMPGDNGALYLSYYGWADLTTQSRWIWIDFQSGATATSIELRDVSRFLITKPEISTSAKTLIALSNNDNVVIADGNLYTVKNTSSWTANDWINTAANAIFGRNVHCVSILRNTLSNVRVGIGILNDDAVANPNFSAMALIQDNTLRDYSGDGIDPNASDELIYNNLITGERVTDADGDWNHDDAIQISANSGPIDNVIVDHNWVQDVDVANAPFQAAAQGITNFDGLINHLRITNNMVLVGAYHGITVNGAPGAVVSGNTVAHDTTDTVATDWIQNIAVSGNIPYNSIIQNNVAPYFKIDPVDIASNNITITDPILYFKTFDVVNAIFDMHPKTGGPLDGTGAGYYPTYRSGQSAPSAPSAGSPTCTLTAAANSVVRNTPVALTLSSTNSTSATIDNGVGSIAVNGTKNGTPVQNTTYTATVTGSGGATATCATRVVVTIPTPTAPPANTTSPIIKYTFDSSSLLGSTFLDASGFNLFGTLVGAATTVAGRNGQALSLTDGRSGVTSDSLTWANLGVTRTLTISMWVYPQNLAGSNYQVLFSHGQQLSGSTGATASVIATSFGGGPSASFSDGTNAIGAGASSNLPQNQWTLVTAVLNGTTAQLYENGSLVGSGSNPAFTGLQQNVANQLAFGLDASRGSLSFYGLIDDARIYNRALSASEVSQLYAGTLALGNGPVTPITRQLALGSKGDDVTTLQRVLKSLGLFNTDATGYLGNVTKNAVTAFQKQNQLAAVGVVGPQTRALINSLLSSIKLPF